MISLHVRDNDFIIISNGLKSSGKESDEINTGYRKLFGYCFAGDNHFNNEIISSETADFISLNNVDVSGVYCAIEYDGESAKITVDPLCQFNLFYYIDESGFSLSSSIELIKEHHSLKEADIDYLFDQLAYQSPMRSKTILKGVRYIQFDDLHSPDLRSADFIRIKNDSSILFTIPNYEKYDSLNYDELLDLYISRLNRRSKIVSKKFDQVHIQLTGGADSRLVLSSFLDFDNIFCYVYGDGNSQNRLIFEELLSSLKVKPVDKIRLVGQPLNNTSRIFRGLQDTNYLKLNNLNTYMNGPIVSEASICKITGYYGANVSGGVVLPPSDTSRNKRVDRIPESYFSYHGYVDFFKEKHKELRRAEFNDRFYINNRGKSHFASHSIADNKQINSLDILYDFINILLVKTCPYSDNFIDKNAISIDLIYKNHRQLAMFPYDSRKIPLYRDFNEVPLINCFDGYEFLHRELNSFSVVRPVVDDSKTDHLKRKLDSESFQDMFQIGEVSNFFDSYPFLKYLQHQNDNQAGILLYYILGSLKMTNIVT